MGLEDPTGMSDVGLGGEIPLVCGIGMWDLTGM